jgi:hypothetical protein
MSNFRLWLGQHRFQAYLASFTLMIVPPLPLFFAARQDESAWIWLLIGLVVTGNLLAIAIP